MDKTANIRQKIISIAGTTATGKSSLAISLAKKIDAEIISADSRQVYRGFDIATAKASLEQMGGIKHYLIDVLEPEQEFSAGVFVEMAKSAINEISAKRKMPIIAGGTGLYLKMLLDGIDMPQGKPDKALRSELETILKQKGSEALYEILKSLDSEFAKNVHPNDTYKIIRSIEILKHSNAAMAQSRGTKEKEFDVLKIALGAKDREVIYNRINRRVDVMLEQGLLSEAKAIYEKNPDLKSFASTIGYQEFIPYFKNECTLEEAVDKIKQNTRRYAKRQLTWFRAQQNIHWFYIDELAPEEIEAQVLELYNDFVS